MTMIEGLVERKVSNLTPLADKALANALRYALARGDNYIGVEHLLAGAMSVARIENPHT